MFVMAISVTLTFPESVITKIDQDRKDVNRSRYVLRLIEKAYDTKENIKQNADR